MPFTISFPLSQTHTEGQQTTGLDPDSAQQVCVRYNTSPQFLNKKYEKLCNFLNKVLQYRKLFSWFDFQNKSPGNSIKVDQDSLKFNFFRKEKVSFHQKCTIFKNIAVIYFINLVKFSLFSVLQIERLIKKITEISEMHLGCMVTKTHCFEPEKNKTKQISVIT